MPWWMEGLQVRKVGLWNSSTNLPINRLEDSLTNIFWISCTLTYGPHNLEDWLGRFSYYSAAFRFILGGLDLAPFFCGIQNLVSIFKGELLLCVSMGDCIWYLVSVPRYISKWHHFSVKVHDVIDDITGQHICTGVYKKKESQNTKNVESEKGTHWRGWRLVAFGATSYQIGVGDWLSAGDSHLNPPIKELTP